MQSTGQRQIASIGQRSDDQTTRVSQILVAVQKFRIHGTNVQIIVIPIVSINELKTFKD